jgi:A/G-specific adenine glycosylase
VSTRQPRFEGSDRQGRGRLLAVLRTGPVPAAGLAGACGWDDDPARAVRVVADLVAEGMVVDDGPGGYRLP